MKWGNSKSWGKSIDRVDDAEREYRQACRTHGADSPEAQAADRKAAAEEARHIREGAEYDRRNG
ncbi:hypothetical protein [Streptomyces mutabilis]|uniref:hypothetical protein n=1 Tax=Streptomyces mutabilis TaxID=67332 RepID=UPI00367F7AAA